MNYAISSSDITLSIKTGLSGLPYAQRHWELSKGTSAVWGHRILAILEAIPLIGMLIALIERIVAWACSSAPLQQIPPQSIGGSVVPLDPDLAETARQHLDQIQKSGGFVKQEDGVVSVTSEIEF